MKGCIVKSLKYRIGAGLCSAAIMVGMAVTVLPSTYAADSHSCEVAYAQDLQDIQLVALAGLHPPTRQIYQVGEEFDSRGLVIVGIDAEEHIHYLAPSLYTLTGFDSAAAGEKIITATLHDDSQLSTSFAVEVVAERSGNYEISNLSENSSDGVVTIKDGAVTVNLDQVPQEDSMVTLKRGVNTAGLKSLSFTKNDGAIRKLVIEPWALAQQSAEPTLASVMFPENLDTLTIGDSAFFQYSSTGAGALARVQFPHKVADLTIGGSAFRQDVRTKASLEDVVFPEQVNTLSIGSMAFRQKFGVESGLRSLVFSVSEGTTVDVKTLAFSVSGSYMAGSPLQTVTINTVNPENLGTQFTVGKKAFHRANADAQWFVKGLKTPTKLKTLLPSVSSDSTLAEKDVKASQVVCFNPNYSDSVYLPESIPSPRTLIPGADSTFTTVLTGDIPTREGYTFLGWNTSADGTGTAYKPGATFSTTSTEATNVLYAQWQADKSMLNFDANGGEGELVVEGKTDGRTTIPETDKFTREGYKFIGWNTVADGSGTVYEAGDLYHMPAGNGVLYAQWEAVETPPVENENPEPEMPGDSDSEPQDEPKNPVIKNEMTPEIQEDMKKLAETGQSITLLAAVMALCAVLGVTMYVKRFSTRKQMD